MFFSPLLRYKGSFVAIPDIRRRKFAEQFSTSLLLALGQFGAGFPVRNFGRG